MTIYPLLSGVPTLELADPDFGNVERHHTKVIPHVMIDGTISSYVRNLDAHVRTYKYHWSYIRMKDMYTILEYLLPHLDKTFMIVDHNGQVIFGKLMSDIRTVIDAYAAPDCVEDSTDRSESGILDLEFRTNA